MKGKLKNGFKFEVNEDIVDNYEFLELYRKAQDDPMYYIDIMTLMLGEKQMEALKESVRGDDGIVHVTKGDYTITNAITEIMEVISNSGTAGKN